MCKVSKYLKKKSKCESGFSLIEVMVAIAIFLIGILGVYQLQLHATNGNALANRVMVSKNWASYTVEELLGKDYDHEDLEDDNGQDPAAPDGIVGLNAPFSGGAKAVRPWTG